LFSNIEEKWATILKLEMYPERNNKIFGQHFDIGVYLLVVVG